MNIDTIQNLRDITNDREFSVCKAKALFALIGVNPYFMSKSFVKEDHFNKIFVGVMNDNSVLWVTSSNDKESFSVSYGEKIYSNLCYDSKKGRWLAG